MALIPTLSIKDSTSFSDAINFSVTDSLTVTSPASSLSTIIAATAGANSIIVPAAATGTYIFVRHTGTTNGTTTTSAVVLVENTNDTQFANLKSGEWMFLPHLSGSLGVQVQAASAVQVEYAYWTI
jgi:ribosomal protein S4E|tara:strand:- start:679 stop:1056 length:378 start_codon:yes stop_codon:yes gene_type:complete